MLDLPLPSAEVVPRGDVYPLDDAPAAGWPASPLSNH